MSKQREEINSGRRRQKKIKVKKRNPFFFILIIVVIGYFSINILKYEYDIWQLNQKKAQLEANLEEET